MKGETVLGLLGGFGALLVVLPFLDISFFSNNKAVFLVSGIIIFVVYRKIDIDESDTKLKSIEKKLNIVESNLKGMIEEQSYKISEMKGWMDAVNFFHKDKKGAMDPLILILLVILTIIILLALQGKL